MCTSRSCWPGLYCRPLGLRSSQLGFSLKGLPPLAGCACRLGLYRPQPGGRLPEQQPPQLQLEGEAHLQRGPAIAHPQHAAAAVTASEAGQVHAGGTDEW